MLVELFSSRSHLLAGWLTGSSISDDDDDSESGEQFNVYRVRSILFHVLLFIHTAKHNTASNAERAQNLNGKGIA